MRRRKRARRPASASLALLVISAFILGACGGAQPTEIPAATPIIESEEPITELAKAVDSQPYFVPGQVILIGNADAIEGRLGESPAVEARLKKIADFDLSYLDGYEPASPGAEELPFESVRIGKRLSPLVEAESLALRLYEIDAGNASVSETVEVVNALNEGEDPDAVFADLNYHVSTIPISPCGDPFIIGGSPFIIGGSPFIIGGSPFIIGGSPVTGAAAGTGLAEGSIFWDQWAFEVMAVAPAASEEAGAHIAVFDTSPFPPEGQRPIAAGDLLAAPTPGTWSLAWPTDVASSPVIVDGDQWKIEGAGLDFTLRVFHAPTFVGQVPRTVDLEGMGPIEPGDMRDHGLFVAGLAHAVSGEPELYLIQVLNEFGCGDLYTLTTAVHAFMQHMLNTAGSLETVVLNLSLGVPQPPPDFFQTLRDEGVDEAFVSALEQEIASLEQTMSAAYARGAVVVAAAGNNSGVNTVEPANLPADYPFVAGVEAENIRGQRACYGNQGDLGAPGADGRRPNTQPSDFCEPIFGQCEPADGGCELGLVSLGLSSDSGYRFWVGSSFAAPLLSGWAADRLAQGAIQGTVLADMKTTFPPP